VEKTEEGLQLILKLCMNPKWTLTANTITRKESLELQASPETPSPLLFVDGNKNAETQGNMATSHDITLERDPKEAKGRLDEASGIIERSGLVAGIAPSRSRTPSRRKDV